MAETRLVDVLRDYTTQMKVVLVISAVSVVLLLLSLTEVEPGTSTYVLALVQLATFAVLLVVMSALLWTIHRG
ncbi:hypothetical protein [Halopelagius fulvigenes]|uniref:Uncharacterized protein n=1 Tax=Halopelagius fulvigenes TaxID=1198324 RepID=A0ABD5TX87_9EURY